MKHPFLLMACGWACAVTVALGQNAPKTDEASDAVLRKALEAVDKGVSQATKAKAAEAADVLVKRAEKAKELPAVAKEVKSAAKQKKNAVTRTFIDSEGECDLLNKQGLAIFREKVAVNREDLKIWCGELEVHLNRDESGKGSAELPGRSTALDTKDIKKAIARAKGNGTVVIWRKTEGGETVSNCLEAIYDGATGNLTLKGLPKVLRNVETYFFGNKESDTITVNQANDVKGTFKVLRMPQKEALSYREGLFARVPGYQPKGKVATDLNSEPSAEKEEASDTETESSENLPQ